MANTRSELGVLSQPKYRADLDGLRAIAVLSVVTFHLFPTWLPGGFIGVDIFFVISGYLISIIIFANIENKTFNFLEFYKRRIRRIFPTLSIILLTCLITGWFYYDANEYKSLGKHVAAGTAFVSNFVLNDESSYFDTVSEQKPLLHLWSLGIEEQFYLIWPLFVWLVYKKNKHFYLVIVTIMALSFWFNIQDINSDPLKTFFLPLTRIWELLFGSLLAISFVTRIDVQNKIYSTYGNLLSLVGLLLLVMGLLLITKESAFPGWWALFPVLGTVCLISAGPSAWINNRLLGSSLMVWFGLISFPLYLWHWPVLVFSRFFQRQFEIGDKPLRVGVFILAVTLAWLVYKVIEKPIRSTNRNIIPLMCSVVICSVGIMGYRVWLNDGYESRTTVVEKGTSNIHIKNMQVFKDMSKLYGNRSCFRHQIKQTAKTFIANGCLDILYPGKPIVFLIGDSHSASLSLGLKPMIKNMGFNFLQVSTGWCEPTSNNNANKICEDINALVIEKLKEIRVDLLIIDAHWLGASAPPYYLGGGNFQTHLNNKLEFYKSLGVRKILVVGQMPTWYGGLPEQLGLNFAAKSLPVPERTKLGLDVESLYIDSLMAQATYPEKVTYVSLANFLCREDGCLTMVGENVETDLIVWDYGHLTPAGSAFVNERIIKSVVIELMD